MDTERHNPVITSTPFKPCHRGLKNETPESGLVSPESGLVSRLDMVGDDIWNIMENTSTSEVADAPSSLDHLNTFLESREVSPINQVYTANILERN